MSLDAESQSRPCVHNSKYGVFNLIGMCHNNLTAGRLEMFVDSKLRAVCDDGWDRADAMEVCQRVFGFTQGV